MKRIITSLALTFLLTLPIVTAQKLRRDERDHPPTSPVKTNAAKQGKLRSLRRHRRHRNRLGTTTRARTGAASYRQVVPFRVCTDDGRQHVRRRKTVDYKTKFEDVYRPLLDQKVKFYAALGNHDDSNQRFYEFFNMEGQEYTNSRKERQLLFTKQQLHGQEADRLVQRESSRATQPNGRSFIFIIRLTRPVGRMVRTQSCARSSSRFF